MLINPRLRTSIRFMPTLAQALLGPGDADAAAFRDALPQGLRERMRFAWERLPERERLRRYGRPGAAVGGFAERMQRLSREWIEEQRKVASQERALVHREAMNALRAGIWQYRPPASIAGSAALTRQVWAQIWSKLSERDDCCDGAPQPPDQPQPRYGLRITRVKCHDQTEGNGILPGNDDDEIYLVSVAVDGAGRVVTRCSPLMKIDDDDNTVEKPAGAWIYPMRDAQGFLDVAVSMYENDGGYGSVGANIAATGAALQAIPAPYVPVAGVALQIIGETIQIADFVDDDDLFGTRNLRWTTPGALEAGVGTTVRRYWGDDWSGDSYDFDVSFRLERAGE